MRLDLFDTVVTGIEMERLLGQSYIEELRTKGVTDLVKEAMEGRSMTVGLRELVGRYGACLFIPGDELFYLQVSHRTFGTVRQL